MKQPDIVLIGAGHVAGHLGKGLHQAGFKIRQVFSRKGANAQILAKEVDAEPITDLSNAATDAAIYLFAVRDDALAPLADKLHAPDAVVLHTAGSVHGDVLATVSSHYGVLYPLQTFHEAVPLDLSTVPFCVSGSDEYTIQTARQLASSLSNRVEIIDDQQREWLHLAAVIANNQVNFLLAQVHNLVEQHGLDFSLLHPLIERTIKLALEDDPRRVQTGPAKRGDHNTIARHLELLAAHPELGEIYRFLSDKIAKMDS